MLWELQVVEQRYRAVQEVLDGASVTAVARRFGVSRQSVHAWLGRYAAECGLGGLGDRSSRPHGCPHQMRPVVAARILEIRRAHPVWGPDRIRYQLERDGISPVPGRTSIYRALRRHGMVEAEQRRSPLTTAPHLALTALARVTRRVRMTSTAPDLVFGVAVEV